MTAAFDAVHTALSGAESEYARLEAALTEATDVIVDLREDVAQAQAHDASTTARLVTAEADLARVTAEFAAYREANPAQRRMLFGSNDSHWDNLNATVPGLLGAVRFYEEMEWPATLTSRHQAYAAQGLLPWVSFKGSAANILSGSRDAAILSWLRAAGECMATWQHEFDNPKKGISSADGKAVYRHLRALKQKVPGCRVRIGPCLQGHATTPPPVGIANFRDWLEPEYIDFVGVDPYAFARPIGAPDDAAKPGNQVGKPMWPMETLLGEFPAWCKANGLPWAIGETSAHPDPADLSKRARWVTESAAFCEANGCVVLSWFHAPWGESGPWYLTIQPHNYVSPEGNPARRNGSPDQPTIDALRALVR